jgi:hypothetical protein
MCCWRGHSCAGGNGVIFEVGIAQALGDNCCKRVMNIVHTIANTHLSAYLLHFARRRLLNASLALRSEELSARSRAVWCIIALVPLVTWSTAASIEVEPWGVLDPRSARFDPSCLRVEVVPLGWRNLTAVGLPLRMVCSHGKRKKRALWHVGCVRAPQPPSQ